MPPLSYIVIAVVLAVLAGLSIPLTLGFSILVWYAVFAAAGCALAVAGAIRLSNALRAPIWAGLFLASPGTIWAVNKLYEVLFSISRTSILTLGTMEFVAITAASVAALRLIELETKPHPVFRAAYGVLAASALLMSANLLARGMGWNLGSSQIYVSTARVISVTASIVKYGSFIAAAVVITLRRDVESWAGVVISLISAFHLYQILRPYFVTEVLRQPSDLLFWLQPIVMLVGGAAVWRIGSVLNIQTKAKQPLLVDGVA
jgi:hypothetical protein